MTDRGKKEDYRIPRSFAVSEDDLDDVAAGLGTADSARTDGTSLDQGTCLIGGSARGECGTGLQASMCGAGGSPDEDCRTGRVR